MPDSVMSRDELASRYLEQLEFEPYPVQEEALLAWFTSEEGVLVCAPTGMGKTLIAEAAAFEALHTRQICYYTTPLIALTEQKFRELQAAAVRWGFHPDDVGLVTGNRRVNPEARVLVVVAEILLNRLLHGEEFDFTDVASVVMDEFHSFADPERGMVWELSLGLLPPHARLLLLSATVGNAPEFLLWLKNAQKRRVELVQSNERKVPLTFEWVPDKLLNEQLQVMAEGDEATRRTPALVFCFNRNECWDVAEQLKGRALVTRDAQKKLDAELDRFDWSQGVGPKLKRLLVRGVGVHHAGLLPKYRRIVEEFFQRKLLQVCVCTETLAAGINLPARSVLLTTLLKGPPDKKVLIAPSSAHQMFGRAGRPQYDSEGFVYAIAHEDDVKILHWREKYDKIPEDSPDPNIRRMKRQMKKKAPTRRSNQQYWSPEQFQKLQKAPPGNLASRGPLPWRLLAYLLQVSPTVSRLRTFVRRRLMDPKRLERNEQDLIRMLMALWAGGYVTLEPEPPVAEETASTEGEEDEGQSESPSVQESESNTEPAIGTLGMLIQEARAPESPAKSKKQAKTNATTETSAADSAYEPVRAHPTPELDKLFIFRSVNPLYGLFLARQFDIADRNERIQALESVLEVPGSLRAQTRPPRFEEMPPGPLATTRLDPELLQRGLALPGELAPQSDDEDDWYRSDRPRILTFAEKLERIFRADLPGVHSLRIQSAWIVGELLRFNGDFNAYVRGRDLVKQEGIIFRHLLRFILLCGEFLQLDLGPTTEAASDSDQSDPSDRSDFPAPDWQSDLREIADQVTESCRIVDPQSTDKMIESAQMAADVVKGEGQTPAQPSAPTEDGTDESLDEFDDFGAGVLEEE